MFERLRNLDVTLMTAKTRAYVAKEEFLDNLLYPNKPEKSEKEKKKELEEKDVPLMDAFKGVPDAEEDACENPFMGIISSVLEENSKREKTTPVPFNLKGIFSHDDDEDSEETVEEAPAQPTPQQPATPTPQQPTPQQPATPTPQQPKLGPDFSGLIEGVKYDPNRPDVRPDVPGGTPVTPEAAEAALSNAETK